VFTGRMPMRRAVSVIGGLPVRLSLPGRRRGRSPQLRRNHPRI